MVGMPVPLPFTEADVKLAAGARSFERGLDYLGAVGDLEISDTQVTASVYGNSEYSVRLVFGDQGLSGSCTCPYGRDGFFCKHCVAVGLSVLEMGEDLTWHIEATRAERQALEVWLQSPRRTPPANHSGCGSLTLRLLAVRPMPWPCTTGQSGR